MSELVTTLNKIRDTAQDAAWYASWYAAGDIARDAQKEQFIKVIKGEQPCTTLN